MSKATFRGASYAFAEFMAQAAREIAAGKAHGARVLHPTADRSKVQIGWHRRAVLRLQTIR